MSALDLRVYLVTDPALALGRPLVEVVRAAVEGGVTLVQLRDKTASYDDLLATAAALRGVLDPYDVPLIVNDRVDVAIAAGAAGVHVGGHDPQPDEARAELGPDAVVGYSAGTVAGLPVQAGALNYVAVGPVWETATKPDAGAAVGVAEIAAVRAATSLPVVGIGGITPERAGDAVRAGADGVAVVSAILSAPDPGAAARALRESVDRALAARG